jgi:hypothetical protein
MLNIMMELFQKKNIMMKDGRAPAHCCIVPASNLGDTYVDTPYHSSALACLPLLLLYLYGFQQQLISAY